MPLRLQEMALPMYFKLHQNILYFETKNKKKIKKTKNTKKNSNTWERQIEVPMKTSLISSPLPHSHLFPIY